MKLDRAQLIQAANKMIAELHTPEARKQTADAIGRLLIAANTYKGYGYNAWRDGGYTQWMADGQPEDNGPYLGDRTMIHFY